MKKAIVAIGAVALLVASLVQPASAGGGKKVTLYLHGNHPFGEVIEEATNISDGTVMLMDATEPSSPAPKSFGVNQPFNEMCTGNSLFPSWQGQLEGTIVGPIKLTAHLVSPPTQIRVRLWVDIPFGSCTSAAAGVEDYVDPQFETIVDVPAGHNELEVVLKNTKLPVTAGMVLELSQADPSTQGRVLYDSPDLASNLQFTLK
jgi:hypothetical protein